MSATITKRADELKPGDVLAEPGPHARSVVCHVEFEALSDGSIFSRLFHIQSGSMYPVYWPVDTIVEVESPALTPAQQHAEELRDTLRNLVDALDNGVRYHAHAVQPMKDAEALLAKIDPPAPPTLEEALEALEATVEFSTDPSKIRGKSPYANAIELIDRARRSGVLK